MNFLNLISDLSAQYASDYTEQEAFTLYGVYNPAPPLAKHIVYRPMASEVMVHLINSYKRTIPKELLLLYQKMNGADLFWVKVPIPKTQINIPVCCLSVFGVPMSNSRERIEPFNISVEDLNRPKNTPVSWLKFGSFYKPEDLSNKYDLFVDTDSGYVFSVMRNLQECCISETWPTIDDCLCVLFKTLS